MSFPFGEPLGGRGECFVTCDCYSIRGDTLGVVLGRVRASTGTYKSFFTHHYTASQKHVIEAF